MLMNSNELMLSINKRLQESGIIDDVTDFFHEHPEYFVKCDDGDIASHCELDIAMICKPSKRQNTGVFIVSSLGFRKAVQVDLYDHTRTTGSKVWSARTINNKEISNEIYE